MTFLQWLVTPFEELPWYHGVLVGLGGGLVIGVFIGLGVGML